MSSRGTEFAIGAVGVMVGALAVFSIYTLQSTPHDQQPQAAEMAALRSALIDLTKHIDELRPSLYSPSSPELASPSTTAQREEVPNQHQAEILAELRKTTSALEALCGILKDSPALHSGTASGMDDALSKPADWNALQATLARPQIERDLTHLTWSVKDVIAKYGTPTRVGPSPNGVGFKVYYENDDGRRLIFHFVQGELVGVYD